MNLYLSAYDTKTTQIIHNVQKVYNVDPQSFIIHRNTQLTYKDAVHEMYLFNI